MVYRFTTSIFIVGNSKKKWYWECGEKLSWFSSENRLVTASTNNGNHSFRCISCVHLPMFHLCFQASSMASWPKAAHPLEGYAISSVVWMDPNKPHLSEISDLYKLCVIYIIYIDIKWYKCSYTSTCLSFHIAYIYINKDVQKEKVCFLERQVRVDRHLSCCS